MGMFEAHDAEPEPLHPRRRTENRGRRVPAAHRRIDDSGRDSYGEDPALEQFDDFLPGYTYAEDVELAFRVSKRWTLVQTPHARVFHNYSPAARVSLPDRGGRVIYSRFYFFKQHREKTPRNLAAFAWTNVGLSAFYSGVALIMKPMGEKGPMLRGIARGYRRVLDDLRGRPVR